MFCVRLVLGRLGLMEAVPPVEKTTQGSGASSERDCGL